MRKPNFFVLTGGPGGGKTTLIEHLRGEGELCVDEAARAVIRQQAASGGNALPWGDPVAYWRETSRRDLAVYDSLAGETRTVFFDRGVVDDLAWARVANFTPDPELVAKLEARACNVHVFTFAPWAEIYVQDVERRQDFAEAARTYDIILQTLWGLGYQVVEVPRTTVAARAEFLRGVISQVSTKARSRT